MAAVEQTKDQRAELGFSHVEVSMDSKEEIDYAYALQPTERPAKKTGLERRLVLKQDLLIIPLLCLTFLVAYLDRNSFGNGRLLGLEKGAHITDDQYAEAAQLFFVGYLIFMLPGNIFLRRFPPNILVGVAVIAFGTFLCAMSEAKSYGAIVALRILIGCGQAFVQGIGMYSSLWWTRTEVGFRGAIYYSTATLSGAFSGLIAYGIGHNLTKKNTNRSPWQWLFIIEGVIAIWAGVMVLILLPPFPDRMKKGKNWLFTKEEIDLAIQRTSTFNTRDSKLEWKQVGISLIDPKTLAFGLITGAFGQCVSSVGIFLPSFIAAFGYTNLDAQLFSVIPYAIAFVTTLTAAAISDKINLKSPFILVAQGVVCIGYVLLLTVKPTSGKMVACCLVVGGAYPGVLLSTVWLGVNNGGFTKRATTWAVAEIFAQLFSIMGTSMYKTSYRKGHIVCLSLLLVGMVCTSSLLAWFSYCNKKRDRVLEEHAARGEAHPHATRSLEEVYDSHVNFRYTL